MTFKFAGARAQVCKYCKFLVARTDRGLTPIGQVADLVEIPSPLSMGVTGYWEKRRFEVEGRVQIDRAGAASAPWQEFLIVLPDTSESYWVAFAQGRWYWTKEIEPTPQLPPFGALQPGNAIMLPQVGQATVAEVGRRRVVSLEGELPKVALPGAITPYIDFGAPGGVFGTIDYGDGQTIAPTLYVGRQFDPTTFKLDSGQPLEAAQAAVTACTCPSCGGSLPLVTPTTTERIVCRYCGTVSDNNNGALSALGQAPRPTVNPFIPLGSEGTLRGRKVICIGFVERGTWVEGGHYTWREYLLYAGPSEGYIWLMEEDQHWKLVTAIPPGEAQISGGGAHYAGKSYSFKQSVTARVEHVVGEFYWKVEIGEEVEATEYQGSDGIVSVERDKNEVNTTFCQELPGAEIGAAFNIAPPPSPAMFSVAGEGTEGAQKMGKVIIWVIIILVIILFLVFSDCSGGSSGGGSSGVYISPGFGGK